MTASEAYVQISNPLSPSPQFAQRKLLHYNRWEYVVQDGLKISRLDFAFREGGRLNYKNDGPSLNFGFILSGNYIHHMTVPGLFDQKFAGSEGTSGIAYLPYSEGTLIIPGRDAVCVVHIHFSLPFFIDLFRKEKENLPERLKAIFSGTLNLPYVFLAGMTLKVWSLLDRLMKGPNEGVPSNLFYQGIALELIAEQVARAKKCPQDQETTLCDNQSKIIYAKDLLTQDLSSPPKLKQLSRKIGLNINKLQQGFSLLYGVSVNKYLQQCRMKEANRLFHETDMNVGQIAAAVGYTNASHFSSTYKRHFGILPKNHMRHIRERL